MLGSRRGPALPLVGDTDGNGFAAAPASRARKEPSSPMVLISGAGNTTVLFLSTALPLVSSDGTSDPCAGAGRRRMLKS
jgi:hypothetical protein